MESSDGANPAGVPWMQIGAAMLATLAGAAVVIALMHETPAEPTLNRAAPRSPAWSTLVDRHNAAVRKARALRPGSNADAKKRIHAARDEQVDGELLVAAIGTDALVLRLTAKSCSQGLLQLQGMVEFASQHGFRRMECDDGRRVANRPAPAGKAADRIRTALALDIVSDAEFHAVGPEHAILEIWSSQCSSRLTEETAAQDLIADQGFTQVRCDSGKTTFRSPVSR